MKYDDLVQRMLVANEDFNKRLTELAVLYNLEQTKENIERARVLRNAVQSEKTRLSAELQKALLKKKLDFYQNRLQSITERLPPALRSRLPPMEFDMEAFL
mmetsp:Transcript_31733/g.48649  ORF Transcript_31733/g.48649 Transcript_31733/m.48649 type:complete len:101 (+) Transcript_31733:213-515(+)|eukprot:CAMPEP_0170483294 /NCGR_PEP_ID=MMETSP0208-20121228/2989_1 /TAXON_ID=197538 /ORGANISM="Strombidium inclinatum, Strain S3" /LENGTH=100 /DNA_ID=CAMNT_0010756273 /DNA_START=213 /DNA_END=515 /DNA_ORIENTATION=-